MLLRGGDVIVMSGRARRCYHGVPRVFGRGGGCKAASKCTRKSRSGNSLVREV
jgi:alkylated DNA repair dioxygenase AlkB